MSRVEITDAMLERAAAAGYVADAKPMHREWIMADPSSRDAWRKFARAALEAALNPPAEPEIEVTEAMLAASKDALLRYSNEPGKTWVRFTADEVAPVIYRAMHAARPKRKGDGPHKYADGAERYEHYRHGDTCNDHCHRRKGDPR